MVLKLVVTEGPVERSEYVLDSFPVTMGRRRDNRIPISDPAVSRYHCQILSETGRPRLVDLGSRNGVLVNGRATTDSVLEAGDSIQVGAAVFRLEVSSLPVDDLNHTMGGRATPNSGKDASRVPETVEFDAEETTYLRRSDASSGSGDRSARDLRALLDLCRHIQMGAGESPDLVQRRLLEALFGAIPAERGAVVLAVPGAVRLGQAVCLDRLRGPVDLALSRTTLASVIDDGRVFLRNRIQRDSEGLPESLVSADVQAALAAPLTFQGRVIGALYLDTTRSDQPFDRQDLDLATAAAVAAAGVLESAFRRQMLERGLAAAWSEWGENPLDVMPSMRQVTEMAVKATANATPLLISGEVGSGRRALAESIHAAGSSADGPFVSVHCSGRGAEEIEAELWGTGDESGKLDQAAGGTLYVVEVGALPSASQARLAALLADDTLEFRLMAATSRDLRARVAASEFLEDLLYYLGPGAIETLPLRSCPEDLPALAEHLARRAAKNEKRPFEGFSREAQSAIKNYGWPGNIREMANALDWAVGARTANVIGLEDLPSEVADATSAPGYHQRVKEAKRRILLDALERSNGSVPGAAEELGINRTYLHRLIRNLEIRDEAADGQ